LTLSHFSFAEQPRRERRHRAVVIELEQASRYGEREDDRAAVRLHFRRDYARAQMHPASNEESASLAYALPSGVPNTRASPAKAGD
jgi:hypothetical protein